MVFGLKQSMLIPMQPMIFKLGGCAVAALMALAGPLAQANVENPYATIVDRNPFGLKPPPPPPAAPEQTAPPVPMAQVTLTGLVSMFGEPRALLEITEEPGKAGTAKKPIMREGERLGPVEILSIDVAKNTVRIRNSGVETNMTFAVAKSTPTPGGPGVPGAPPAYTPPSLGQPQPGGGQPTVISANANSGGGVTLVGGNSGSPTASAPGALGSADGGMRSIPSRPLRTENSGGLPPMTREQADLLMEANRLRGGLPPSPPTSLTPIIEGAQREGNPNPAFPQLPYRRGIPPPVPGKQ